LVVIHYEWSSFTYFANLFMLNCLSKVQIKASGQNIQ
jgi:hypothetical protein